MFRLLKQIDRAIGAVLGPVVFAGMIALIGVISVQIVSRVFFTSVSWTEEVARFLLIWITFLGAALAYQQGRHIAVTLLCDSLPSGLRRAVTCTGLLVVIAFLVMLAMVGWHYMGLQSFQKSPSLRISMGLVYAVMPVCAVLMAALSALDMFRLLRGGETRRHAAPEAME